jgi:hypothetical protein
MMKGKRIIVINAGGKGIRTPASSALQVQAIILAMYISESMKTD